LSLAIAIDAMGGDHAPREVVRGVVDAARVHKDAKLLLVGIPEKVREELNLAGAAEPNIEVVPAQHVIDMADSPVEALRRKKGSSIEVATRLVREGQASAMVSAGNTGACVAAGTILLGLLPDVRRAGIAVTFHAGSSPVTVIDVGANISSKPEHLIQYGIMASIYAKAVFRTETPRVGLLNIGEEDEKGNSLVKSTHSLFRQSRLNFLGNIEGVEIFRGVCDVIVCDGFVGNIVLKVAEGLAERLVDLFQSTLEQTLRGLSGKLCFVGEPASGEGESGGPMPMLDKKIRGALLSLRERLDYTEYGGAPLLGVNGTMIIAHGRSDARAVTNAVRVARRMVETEVNKHITEEIHALSERA
jgi:glycerol-3-phosphate acyltransferase PlsX